MSYWYISNSKLNFEGSENVIPISLEDWRDIVDNDDDLTWYDITPLGIEDLFGEFTTEEDRKKRIRTSARMDLTTEGNGKVQFNYLNKEGYRYIAIIHPKENLKRIEKYYEIANRLNAKLFKSQTWINEEKMKKIREIYKQKKGKAIDRKKTDK